MLIPRRPGWAGVMLGVTFAIRFQTGILIATVVGLLLVECLRWNAAHWRKMARLAGGLGIALLAVGWLDRETLGTWFHSPIEYFRANISENKSAAFGTKPWDFYLAGCLSLFGAFPLAGLCSLAGACREWRLAIMAIIYVAVHSAIGHKESRFLWTLAPAALLLCAVGVQMLWNGIEHRPYRIAAVVLVIFSAGWVEGISFSNIPWNRKPYVVSASALTVVGRRPDVTGVAVYATSRFVGGNYFYLRRPVPLVMEMRLEQLLRSLEERREINYLVADSSDIAAFEKWRPIEVGRAGDMGIYRLHRPE